MAITVLKGIPFLRQELTKLFMKKAAEKSGIMTVPFKNKKLQLDIEDRLQKYIRDAEKQGVDLDMVSNENLKYTINLNENVDPISRAISADSSEGKAITDKLFGKKGEVIEGNFGKPFKEQIEDMKKSGDIVDVEDVKISEKITDRDMFKNADQRLKGPIKGKMDMGEFGKVDVETDYSASINRKEFFDPKAKNMYDKTVKTGPEFFKAQKEKILNTINRKKKEMVPPTHSNYKLLKKSLQDQEDALEAIKVTEDLGGNENMFDFLRTQNIADYKAKPLQRSNYTKTDAEIKAEIEAGNKKGIESLKNKKDDPEGFYTGGMVDVEPNLSDIGHGSDALMARTRLVSPDGQATTSTGLNYLLAEDNDNIRVPFENGGDFKQFQKEKMMQLMQEYQQYLKNREIEKKQRPYMEKRMGTGPGPILEAAEGGRIGFAGGGMGRRAFLKLLASIGGGVAAAKSGILGLGKGAGKQVTKEVAKEVATGSGTVPPYFLNLVSKIKNLGDDAPRLATKDREKVTTYKDYTLTEDVTTGEKTIQRMKVTDDGSESFYGQPLTEETYMSYKPGQADELTKGKTPPDEYEEGTALLRSDKGNAGEIVEESATISDDVIKEGTVFEDTLSEFGKADGGRIGYGIGGLSKLGITGSSRRFLEKIFGKGNLDEMIKRDPEMHRGLLEVTEMFRNRDKEGLKKYMQKFLPHMDDATVEDFIIGGQGSEGISGQLIRLGSGRDYKAKIEAIKKLEDAQKLDTLDVTEEMIRKPNAFGGIQTMLGE